VDSVTGAIYAGYLIVFDESIGRFLASIGKLRRQTLR